MEVDASAYAVGAILFQKDNQGHKRDVGYYLKALNPAQCNYNIWDREFLAVIKALENWQHLLRLQQALADSGLDEGLCEVLHSLGLFWLVLEHC
jgi:hypothetical protein